MSNAFVHGRKGMVSALCSERHFYHFIHRIYVAKGIKNIFRKLMLDSSSSIVSASEDIFSYRNVLMCCFLSFEMLM
jgi:hypothetical protein